MNVFTAWGPWKLDRINRVLRIDSANGPYEVDLGSCRSSPEVLDWIYQITGKPWADDAVLAGFVRAIGDILDPQVNLCSWGQSTELSESSLHELVRNAETGAAK